MRPFQEFRLWARRAPLGERVATSVAMVIVVGLIAWLVVPTGGGDPFGDDLFASDAVEAIADGGVELDDGTGDARGTADDANVGTTAVTRRGGSRSGGSAGPAAGSVGSPGTGGGGSDPGSAAAQGCASPPGSATGITDSEVHVAIALTNLVIGNAANSLFDVPPPDEARADFEAVIAGINREGGVACRKLVGHFHLVNPADEAQMMEFCREMADADVFAVVDTGSLATRPAVLACFGQNEVPYFGAYYITQTAREQFYPYIFSFYYKEQLYKNTAFGLRDLGFYDSANGFEKLGFIYRDCEREAVAAFRRWIREAGVPDNLVVTYNVGCPSIFADDATISQAVLTFQREGVTHVTTANFRGEIAAFTRHAEQQGYRPKYGFPDEAMISTAGGRQAPNPDNIANALAITLGRDAEDQTPGMTPTAGTQRCNGYYQAAGQPPVYEQVSNAGHACDQLWMLQDALGRAPEIHRAALVAGLQRTQSIDFAYPQGPNDFSGRAVTTGGQFWRVAQFKPDCECWQVIQPQFQPGF